MVATCAAQAPCIDGDPPNEFWSGLWSKIGNVADRIWPRLGQIWQISVNIQVWAKLPDRLTDFEGCAYHGGPVRFRRSGIGVGHGVRRRRSGRGGHEMNFSCVSPWQRATEPSVASGVRNARCWFEVALRASRLGQCRGRPDLYLVVEERIRSMMD